jgi:dTDP-4-dehydrorhamnose reductase
LIDGLKKGTLYPQFTDHWFSPTIVEDLARALDWVINTKQTGIYHCTSGVKVSDYEYASMINSVLNIGAEVKKGSLEEYLKTAKRPYQKNTAMGSTKLAKASGIEWTSLEQAIQNIETIL